MRRTISPCAPRAQALAEDDRAAAAQQHAMLEMRLDRATQHPALGILPLRDQIVDAVGMIDDRDVLRDDRPLVEIGRHVMRSGADHLHAAIIGAMIGVRALEAGQETVVDVDHAPIQPTAQRIGQDLHVAREDDQIDLLLIDQSQQRLLLIELVLRRDRQVMIGNGFMLGAPLPGQMVRDDAGDRHRQAAGGGSVEQIVEAVAALRDHDDRPRLGGGVVQLPIEPPCGRDRREGFAERLGGQPIWRGELDAHEEAAGAGIAILRILDDVAVLRDERIGDRRDDALAIFAGEQKDELAVILGHPHGVASGGPVRERSADRLVSLIRYRAGRATSNRRYCGRRSANPKEPRQ